MDMPSADWKAGYSADSTAVYWAPLWAALRAEKKAGYSAIRTVVHWVALMVAPMAA